VSAEPEGYRPEGIMTDSSITLPVRTVRRLPTDELAAYTPRSFTEARDMAEFLAKSELIPAAFRGKPADILVAAGMGAALGLSMMQALQSIYVVQGRPALYVAAALGIVRAQGQLESLEVHSDESQATATVRRVGGETMSATFTFDQAQRMNLTRNPSWQAQRTWMLETRALGRVLHRLFPDLLRGLGLVDPAGRAVEMPDAEEAYRPEADPPSEGEPRPAPGRKLAELTKTLPPAPPAAPRRIDPHTGEVEEAEDHTAEDDAAFEAAAPAPTPSTLERSLLLSNINTLRSKHNVPEAVFSRMCGQVGVSVAGLGSADPAALSQLLELLGHRREQRPNGRAS
jgi:hypothetical protein